MVQSGLLQSIKISMQGGRLYNTQIMCTLFVPLDDLTMFLHFMLHHDWEGQHIQIGISIYVNVCIPSYILRHTHTIYIVSNIFE